MFGHHYTLENTILQDRVETTMKRGRPKSNWKDVSVSRQECLLNNYLMYRKTIRV